MKTVDLGSIFVAYNFVIGILLMLSSQRIGSLVGNLSKVRGQQIQRLTKVSTFTFGATVAALMGFVYIVFFTLRIGV